MMLGFVLVAMLPIVVSHVLRELDQRSTDQAAMARGEVATGVARNSEFASYLGGLRSRVVGLALESSTHTAISDFAHHFAVGQQEKTLGIEFGSLERQRNEIRRAHAGRKGPAGCEQAGLAGPSPGAARKGERSRHSARLSLFRRRPARGGAGGCAGTGRLPRFSQSGSRIGPQLLDAAAKLLFHALAAAAGHHPGAGADRHPGVCAGCVDENVCAADGERIWGWFMLPGDDPQFGIDQG